MIQQVNITVSPADALNEGKLKTMCGRLLSVPSNSINDIAIVKRSIDARRRPVKVNLTLRVATEGDLQAAPDFEPVKLKKVTSDSDAVLIVGAGPAGLFAALRALELGLRPIVVERGKDVDTRRLDITALSRSGKVNPDSNYCFGEGGAGTFSDGKLFTRSKKRGNIEEVLRLLHQYGAQKEILIESHPHIGSDKLPKVIKSIREAIIAHGGEVRFNTKMSRLLFKDHSEDRRQVIGIETSTGERIYGPVVLATGHSARDVYRSIHSDGVKLEEKGFAMGVRLEHPQALIDKIQYHTPEGRGQYLPAAEYNFVCQSADRGVYSFCMCPGGVIVPAASADGESVVNGMSASARASKLANSGMVVEIRPGDIPGFEKFGPLGLLEFQAETERKFFEASGNTLNAPAQRMSDFTNGKLSSDLPQTSYVCGIHSERLDLLLPSFISSRLQEGFKIFGKRAKGFLTNDACLIGLESRTSSPVRIPRDNDTLEHIEIEDLYPAGEGAGYAGGIISAAVDGRRCIDSIYNKKMSSDRGQGLSGRV